MIRVEKLTTIISFETFSFLNSTWCSIPRQKSEKIILHMTKKSPI